MYSFIASLFIESPYSGIVLEHAQCKTLKEAQRFILETVAKQEDVPLDTIEFFEDMRKIHNLDSCLLEIAKRFGSDLCIYRYKITMNVEQSIQNQ